MNIKKRYPIMWFRGMNVGPESFQQNSLYIQDLIINYSKMTNNLGWGIFSLEYDLSNLSEGFFKLKNLQGLNEDFLYFEVYETNNLQINLKDYKNEFKNDKELYIYLSYPKNEFTPQTNENAPKYSTELLEIEDLNNKSEKTELAILKPNYFLELSDSKSLKNDSIIVAKIKYNGMSFTLSKYTPPIQQIRTSDLLDSIISSLIIKMKDKAKYLKNIKRLSVEQYSQLTSVSNMLFSLEAALKSNDHPFSIYKLIVQAVSNSFILSKSTDIPHIEPYKHDNIIKSIYPLIEYINSNLDLIFESFKLTKFTKTKNNKFEILFKNTEKNYILIAIEKDSSTKYEDINNWILSCRIATRDKMDSTKEQRSKGAERIKVENYKDFDIQEIPDMSIVKINIKDSFITDGETLLIENDNESLPTPPSIYLIEL